MARYGLSGIASRSSLGQSLHPILLMSSPPDLQKRTYDSPDHVPEEPVSADGKDQIITFGGRISHHPDMIRGVSVRTGKPGKRT